MLGLKLNDKLGLIEKDTEGESDTLPLDDIEGDKLGLRL